MKNRELFLEIYSDLTKVLTQLCPDHKGLPDTLDGDVYKSLVEEASTILQTAEQRDLKQALPLLKGLHRKMEHVLHVEKAVYHFLMTEGGPKGVWSAEQYKSPSQQPLPSAVEMDPMKIPPMPGSYAQNGPVTSGNLNGASFTPDNGGGLPTSAPARQTYKGLEDETPPPNGADGWFDNPNWSEEGSLEVQVEHPATRLRKGYNPTQESANAADLSPADRMRARTNKIHKQREDAYQDMMDEPPPTPQERAPSFSSASALE